MKNPECIVCDRPCDGAFNVDGECLKTAPVDKILELQAKFGDVKGFDAVLEGVRAELEHRKNLERKAVGR